MSEEDMSLFHCIIPWKHRLMCLLGFVRTHVDVPTVVLCAGNYVAEFLKIVFNLFEIRSESISSAKEESLTKNAITSFESESIFLLFVPTDLFLNLNIPKAKYMIQFDIPPSIEVEKKIFSMKPSEKVVIFLEDNQIEYLKLLEVKTTEMPFSTQKIPKMLDKVLKWAEKNYPIHCSSFFGYRELMFAFRSHPNYDIFNPYKLNLIDVAKNLGQHAPPKLPLDKNK